MQRSAHGRSRSVLALVSSLAAVAMATTGCGSSAASASARAGATSGSASSSGSVSSSGSGSASHGASDASAASPAAAGDTGAHLTMWTRDSTGEFAKRMVDAYNGSHKNRIALTVIPNDSYVQKVGQAAGSHTLPDLLVSDVVYSPNFIKQGLFADISDKLKSLPFYDALSPAHIKAASADGKLYGVPFKIDSSLNLYNKDLFKKAGLDPANPPKGYDAIYADAKQIRDKIGGDTYGLSIAGNCGGCQAYTTMPYGVADGRPVVKDGGQQADLTSDALVSAYTMYRKAFANGLVPPSDKNEAGPTWGTAFMNGKIGIMPMGSFKFADIIKEAKFDWGVFPLTNADGSKTSTFVGGDELSIAAGSKNVDAAFNALAWTLGDDAQVNVVAQGGDLPSRTDLANNKYSAKYPQVVETIKDLANGWTPSAVNYNAAFNDPNGPWLATFRSAVFGTSDVKAVLADGEKKVDALLQNG